MIRLPGLRAPLNWGHYQVAKQRLRTWAEARFDKRYAQPPSHDHAEPESFPEKVIHAQPMLTREEKVRLGFTRAMRFVEVGPSHNPLIPKRDGWEVWTVDHTTREGLVEKYRGHPGVDVGRIEDVDFIWTGQRLDELVPEEMRGTFDACVASHVIEHIPDLIGFFRGACNLLTPNGVVSLAIPDKRYCFDWFRPHSTTGQILEAHRNADFRHRPAALFDQSAYASTNNGTIGWTQAPLGAMKLMTPTLISAYGFFNSQPSDDYVDCHGWQFTPASFELIVLELAAVGVIDFEIETAFPSEGCEFIVQMRKVQKLSLSGDRLEAKRLELLHRIVEELGVQADHQRAALALMR